MRWSWWRASARDGVATVMVYSASADPELAGALHARRSARVSDASACADVMAEALVRAAARRPVTQAGQEDGGKLLAFMGAKGGAGATMLACNFAVALAKESEQKTLLIDLDLPLGDAALNLGIVAEFSTIDALQAGGTAGCGVSVAASGEAQLRACRCWRRREGLFSYQASNEAINRLLQVARQEFDNVVVDLGSKLDLMGTAAYQRCDARLPGDAGEHSGTAQLQPADLAVFLGRRGRSWRS